ncbi:MAG: 2-C-methyl-D-erythritol 4-phosphate cytidylyltransferase [Gammaproteobacteria bacterium]|nr:2-C-methyl-D-erythritol 4-phosphate cytidylyltransferase [Gammaproteobacteria bacterium]
MSNNPPVWAIVPASGVGQRMQSDRPKQYLSFCGKTVIEHTIDRLVSYTHIHGIILVLDKEDKYWENINYVSDKLVLTVDGGDERQDSVINGLIKLHQLEQKTSQALVHDAVRPLVPLHDLSLLSKAFEQNSDGAILASPVADTLKRADELGYIKETIDRFRLWRALTPQLFDSKLLLNALEQARESKQLMTDDASAMEAMGYRPSLVEGSGDNIKITRPGDLALAERIWLSQQSSDHLN